jgi:hypothetical protein
MRRSQTDPAVATYNTNTVESNKRFALIATISTTALWRALTGMFDPDRLKPSHIPGGWMPVGAKSHGIQGHEFGLKLEGGEREQLIAFLRTL